MNAIIANEIKTSTDEPKAHKLTFAGHQVCYLLEAFNIVHDSKYFDGRENYVTIVEIIYRLKHLTGSN